MCVCGGGGGDVMVVIFRSVNVVISCVYVMMSWLSCGDVMVVMCLSMW